MKQPAQEFTTYFVDADGNALGDMPGLLAVTLFKGMIVTIHGHSGLFKVVDWNFHHGHPDEQAGLRVILGSP